jgi:hypothetical protein
MSQWSAELDRVEELLWKLHGELNHLSRRFTQHEQALMELASKLAAPGQGEVLSPLKEKESSVEP